MARKTIKQRIDKNLENRFVGREEQIDLFVKNLALGDEHDDFKNLFFIHGIGGVGKSRLIDQYRNKAKESFGALTGYVDESVIGVPAVLNAFVEGFEDQREKFKEFESKYKKYLQMKEQLDADTEGMQFAGFFGRTLAKGALTGIKFIPGVGEFTRTIEEIIPQDQMLDKVGAFAEFVSRKFKDASVADKKLILNPNSELTPLFLKGLTEIDSDQIIVLFFDTFEFTGQFLDEWIRNVLDERFGEVPVNIVFVIAGRDELEPNNWSDYFSICSSFSLEPFTDEETKKYLAFYEIVDEDLVNLIIEISGNLPILVTTLAELKPKRITDIYDVTDTAIERIMKWVGDPNKKETIIKAAFPRFLNEEVLKSLKIENQREDFTWLERLPFIRTLQGGDRIYHDVIRKLLLRYQKQVNRGTWIRYHENLTQYFIEKQGSLDGNGNITRKKEWQTFELEKIYHSYCAKSSSFFGDILDIFLESSFKNDNEFIKLLISVIHNAEKDLELGENQKVGEILDDLFIAFEKENGDKVLECLMKLNGFHIQGEKYREHVLYLQGIAYQSKENYQKSIEYFLKLIELTPDKAEYLYSLGVTYHLAMDFERAIEEKNKAIALEPLNAKYYVSRGYSYNWLRNFVEAIADTSKAIELEPGNASNWCWRGLSYYAAGNYTAAIADASKAIELEPENALYWDIRGGSYLVTGYHTAAIADASKAIELEPGIASYWNSRGVSYHVTGNYTAAIADCDKAIELEPGNAKYWNSRGVSYHAAGEYQAAIADLSKAIELEPGNALYWNNRSNSHHEAGE
ncbi:MAG: hypothetical protein CVU39_06135, partial [Chloroflexi bacterium HGW-Chloroflexi-10]